MYNLISCGLGILRRGSFSAYALLYYAAFNKCKECFNLFYGNAIEYIISQMCKNKLKYLESSEHFCESLNISSSTQKPQKPKILISIIKCSTTYSYLLLIYAFVSLFI